MKKPRRNRNAGRAVGCSAWLDRDELIYDPITNRRLTVDDLLLACDPTLRQLLTRKARRWWIRVKSGLIHIKSYRALNATWIEMPALLLFSPAVIRWPAPLSPLAIGPRQTLARVYLWLVSLLGLFPDRGRGIQTGLFGTGPSGARSWSNENKLSDRRRERAWLESKLL